MTDEEIPESPDQADEILRALNPDQIKEVAERALDMVSGAWKAGFLTLSNIANIETEAELEAFDKQWKAAMGRVGTGTEMLEQLVAYLHSVIILTTKTVIPDLPISDAT